MRLTRTFHPVGHGAFYTERFYEGGECVFTAVYDCGSDTLSSNDLSSLVTAEFPQGSKIDALFISHFHRDHISGVKYLIDKCDKIFLPQLTKEQKLELIVQNIIAATEETEVNPVTALDEDEALWVIKQFYSDTYGEYMSRIVEVPFFNSEDGIGELNPNSAKKCSDCSGQLSVGQGIKIDDELKWIYYPMNLNHKFNITFNNDLDNVVDDRTGFIDFNALRGILTNAQAWKKIKKKYTGDIKSYVANEYSMTVYSGYVYPYRANYVHAHCFCDCDYYCCGRPACYYRCHDISNSGCLYMGDFVAENKNVDNLIKFYGIYHENSDVIHVPHHGSRRLKKDKDKYGFQLYDNCKIGVISTQFGLYNGIPSADVIQALKTNRVCPKIITQKNFTRLELHYHLK